MRRRRLAALPEIRARRVAPGLTAGSDSYSEATQKRAGGAARYGRVTAARRRLGDDSEATRRRLGGVWAARGRPTRPRPNRVRAAARFTRRDSAELLINEIDSP